MLWSAPVKAASISLEGLRFTEVAGDFTITGGETAPSALRLFQDVTGPNIDLFTAIEGLSSTRFIGFRFESVLTNRTDTPWIFFDHELQEKFRIPSPEEDGLSFAQQFSSLRPFTSNAYSIVDEVTDVRDFVNFSGGVVNPGQTVTFRYAILDNSPTDLFYLRQRPNFAPGGVGVVAPLPVAAPTPTPPPLPAPPTVLNPPDPSPDAQPDPPSLAKVPESGVSKGLLWLTGVWLVRLMIKRLADNS
ncbi:MAG: hypothetical protein AAGF01_23465 [Cyanobacteria bacterium P01_G01_bin.38]